MSESRRTMTKWRIEKFKENVRREYDQDSIIEAAVGRRCARPSDTIPFVQIGTRFLAEPTIFIDSYSAGGVYTVPEMVNLGRSLALGEEKYLIERLENSIRNRLDEQILSLETISRAIKGVGHTFSPSTVFIPIDFFSILHLDKVDKVHISYEGRDCYLLLESTRLRVFWSNKYVPYDNLIFVDKRLGEWVVKPDPVDKHWLTIDIKPTDEKVDVTAKTVACYSILDAGAGLVLKVPLPK